MPPDLGFMLSPASQAASLGLMPPYASACFAGCELGPYALACASHVDNCSSARNVRAGFFKA